MGRKLELNADDHGQPIPPTHFYGTVTDTTTVDRDAGKIAEEVIAHLAGLVGAKVTVTLKISAEVHDGVPDNVVRIVTENSRTLKFTGEGFEQDEYEDLSNHGSMKLAVEVIGTAI